MRHVHVGIAALAAALTMAGGPASAQPQQGAPAAALFTAAATPAADRAATDPRVQRTVIRERYVTANLQALADTGRALAGQQEAARPRLLLNLFDGLVLTAVLDRFEDRAGGVAWMGHLDDAAPSSVTLVTDGPLLAGSISSPAGVYAIRPAGDNLQAVSEVDPSRFLPEGNPIPVQSPPGAASAADQPQPQPDTGARLDVLVLYTTAARNAAGGSTALMLNRINLGVTETNQSYANSGVTQTLRLVGTQEIAGYADNNDLGLDLDAVTNPGTTVGATAAALRNTYGADLVVFITSPTTPNYCGIAWFMQTVSSGFAPSAFSVVENTCVSPNYTFGHEMGHNMGATHDWYVDNGKLPYTYSHGYVNTTAGNRFRTMMAYDNLCQATGPSCARLLYWSNPNLTRNGAAMGIAANTKSDCPTGNTANVSCDADDHQVLNNTAFTVANFRQEIATGVAPSVTTHPSSQTVTVGSSASFTAAASGTPAPTLQWQVSTNSGGSWASISGATSSPYAFAPLITDDRKQYRAVFTNTSGTANSNAATLYVVQPFTDNPLQTGVTAVKAVHITELRTRIASLRARYSLPVITFTDSTLTAGTTVITATHINELRAALAAVYTAANRPLPTYTDSTLTAGVTSVKAVHISELRAAVVAIE